jgi:hypothetical protein
VAHKILASGPVVGPSVVGQFYSLVLMVVVSQCLYGVAELKGQGREVLCSALRSENFHFRLGNLLFGIGRSGWLKIAVTRKDQNYGDSTGQY